MRFLTFLLCIALSVFGVGFLLRGSGASSDIYGLSFTTIDGQPLPLAQFKGKVVLVVNTASRCGFTKQYAGLQKLYKAYEDKGLVVLGVPSNDFANQEPGSAHEIKKFCEVNFNITFPMSEKETVTGDNAHPFFKQVRQERGFLASPHWNFYKYLISRDGRVVNWFASTTGPDSSGLLQAVEAELAKGK